MIATVDPILDQTKTLVLNYFDGNLPTVLTLVIGIAMLVWILKLTFRSIGINSTGDLLSAIDERFVGTPDDGTMVYDENGDPMYLTGDGEIMEIGEWDDVDELPEWIDD
jgi:hypothetical protein